jgi:uncharacterized membrane protein YqjE
METFFPDSVKAVLLGLIAVAFVLSRLACWFPHVAWLQLFRLPVIQMSEEQREKRRRSGNRMAGLEMVLVGIGLPVLYIASTIMFWSDPQPIPLIIVITCSVICIAVGIWIFVRNW